MKKRGLGCFWTIYPLILHVNIYPFLVALCRCMVCGVLCRLRSAGCIVGEMLFTVPLFPDSAEVQVGFGCNWRMHHYWLCGFFLVSFLADSNIWDIVSTHSGDWGLKEDPESLDSFQRGPWVVGLMERNSHLFSWRFSFVFAAGSIKSKGLLEHCADTAGCVGCLILKNLIFMILPREAKAQKLSLTFQNTRKIDRMIGPAACENISTGRNSGSKSIGQWHLGTEFFCLDEWKFAWPIGLLMGNSYISRFDSV